MIWLIGEEEMSKEVRVEKSSNSRYYQIRERDRRKAVERNDRMEYMIALFKLISIFVIAALISSRQMLTAFVLLIAEVGELVFVLLRIRRARFLTYNIRQASTMLGVKVRTIREWIRTGKIEAVKSPKSGRWIIDDCEIRRIKEEAH